MKTTLIDIDHKNVEQSKKDVIEYEQYLIIMKEIDSRIIRKSFKEIFGYEIILLKDGGFELRGERFF